MASSVHCSINSNEAKLLWIHCYKCFEIYVKKERRIFFTTCQHLACENCLQQSLENPDLVICPKCMKSVRVKEIGNNMPRQIKDLFHPDPYKDGLPTANILRFQEKHRVHFEEGMKMMAESLEAANLNLELWREKTRKTYDELQKVRRSNKIKEVKVRRIIAEKKRARAEAAQRQQIQQQASSVSDSGLGGFDRVSPNNVRPIIRASDPIPGRYYNLQEDLMEDFLPRDNVSFTL